jgi:hypothetical protein
MTGFYQIGWSDSHHRDIRLEVEGSLSAPIFRISRKQVNGETTYIRLLMGEAVRLYNALGKAIYNQQQVEKQYRETEWAEFPDEEDDPLGSD